MVSKKAILDNELIKEIIAIRTNTLWKMLRLEQQGNLPSVHDEGATGKFDNKGALFIPGGLVLQDVDENPVEYTPYPEKTARTFRQEIRRAMGYDNATLLSPEGIATSINLDGGFWSKAARRIYTNKKAAFRRKKKIGKAAAIEVNSLDIIRSHCPSYLHPPYGSRTRISSYVATALMEPAMFFAYCRTQFNFCDRTGESFTETFDKVREPVTTDDKTILYAPQIVVCHDSRCSKSNYTGLTRILGIGKFGEFATFTLEKIDQRLLRELKRKRSKITPEEIFARYGEERIAGILRVYAATNPGKRSINYKLYIVSPAKDLDLQTDQLEAEARAMYNIP